MLGRMLRGGGERCAGVGWLFLGGCFGVVSVG